MHLGNGAITPECVALTAGAAAAGLGVCAVTMRIARPTPDKLLMAAGLGCLVFTAQAINVPVAPGISAHLVGGVLLAGMLGPGLGAWTMAVVLAFQAIALGDGSIASLGANMLNMALVPAAIAALARRITSVSQRPAMSWLASGIAAGFAVPVAALLIVAEIALFRPAAELTGWTSFATLMVGTHVWIGLLEGAVTVVLVAALRPMTATAAMRSAWGQALLGVAAGLLIAALLLPISSPHPDGYEAAAQASGMSWLLGP